MTASAKDSSATDVSVVLDQLQELGGRLQELFFELQEDPVGAGRVAEALSFMSKSVEAFHVKPEWPELAVVPVRAHAKGCM